MLEDKVVMITGGSSGIGAATARTLVGGGAKVMLGARRVERLGALCAELGDRAAFRRADVSRREDLLALADEAIARFGRIDALVNNAGIMPISPLAARRVEDWDRMIDVNIKGVLYGIDAVLQHMLERGDGDIINVSSVSGIRIVPTTAVYSATKFAVKAISEGLRLETLGKLRVTTIYPGATATELSASVGIEAIRNAWDAMSIPAERIGEAIAYALSQPKGTSINELVIRPTLEEV